jgi:hypothetical protein
MGENHMGTHLSEDLGVDGRIIRWILEKLSRRVWT